MHQAARAYAKLQLLKVSFCSTLVNNPQRQEIKSLVAAVVLLSCVAGVYAVTNTPVALAVAITAGFALFVGVKWVADRR